MNQKYIIVTFILYIAAIIINVIPSIKYPDYELTLFHLITSILFFIILFVLLKKSPKRFVNTFLIIAASSSALVFIINSFVNQSVNNLILDVMSSIQYPLFIFFVTPFFGINYLLNVNYDLFASFTSIAYIVILSINNIRRR
ncbi:hypothetical protein ACLIA0_07920 [Bacillaceae bacterium W0354]